MAILKIFFFFYLGTLLGAFLPPSLVLREMGNRPGLAKCHFLLLTLIFLLTDPLNLPDDKGRTALMLAAQNQQVGAIRLLTTFTLRKPKTRQLDQQKVISEIFRRVNRTDKMGRTAVHQTAVNGQIEGLKVLWEAGAAMDTADCFGRQAMHMAAASGQVETLAEICQALDSTLLDVPSADVIAPMDKRGFTPLHMAAYWNHPHCVLALFNYEAYNTPIVSFLPLLKQLICFHFCLFYRGS